MYIVPNFGVLLLGTSHGVGKEFCKPELGWVVGDGNGEGEGFKDLAGAR